MTILPNDSALPWLEAELRHVHRQLVYVCVRKDERAAALGAHSRPEADSRWRHYRNAAHVLYLSARRLRLQLGIARASVNT